MKTLLFTFPSRGGSTSVWHYLKQHPEIYPSRKKFMNISDGHWLYWSEENVLEEHWRSHTPDNYYNDYIYINRSESGVWMDGTDDVLDKKYLSLLKIKLKKFNRFCAIYTLRDPFDWYVSFYVFFKMGQYSLYVVNPRREYIENVVIPKYNLNNVKNNFNYFKDEFFKTVPKISQNLSHLYTKFSKEDIWIDHLENVFKKQSDIFNWLNIDSTCDIGKLPHVNSTTDAMYRTFGTYDVYNFWKSIIKTDDDMYNYIINDCLEVKKKFDIDLIEYYKLGVNK